MPKLFVIPGHGAGDSGACGNGYCEAERVRTLATCIKKHGGESVILADFSRNYYEDNGISYLNLPDDTCIVELHMDSGTPGAHGGHVIVAPDTIDQYDINLAQLMIGIFPGRSASLVERSDLANPNRALARGFNYRLVENGFISNAGDVEIFNTRMDELAIGYLRAFGIKRKDDDLKYVDNYGGVVYRLKNPNGFHYYTKSAGERYGLKEAGWIDEGVAFTTRRGGSDAVYRMYNPANGDHLYTTNYNEATALQNGGWNYEGVPFFAWADGTPVYRMFNPYTDEHMLTASKDERDKMISDGWNYESSASFTV